MGTGVVTVEVEGLDRLLRILGNLETVRRRMDEPTRAANALLLKRAQHYPPELPGQRYVRTFRLRNSWQQRVVMQGDVLGTVESVGVKYAPYVQSHEDQAQIHRGRWDTEKLIAEQEQPNIQKIFGAWLEEQVDVR